MNARVEAVMEMAKTWPTEDQAELLDALFGLVSPAGGELEAHGSMNAKLAVPPSIAARYP